ncbi:hypothetical protein Ddye_014369 [Dipteronia dyeriana]|uniref:F-box domain-containing protein n=1 Tax=Dipteronia dyeriana TaxID=168575 RepID=A0AAD9X870_9ROSI|nr:hypothetical protein Ddye_014369 [Dipteronia dyeriana]
MMKTEIQKVDRISELPEPILHHILSFLYFREVARTCILSKKWEPVWLSYPVNEIYLFIIEKMVKPRPKLNKTTEEQSKSKPDRNNKQPTKHKLLKFIIGQPFLVFITKRRYLGEED